MEIQCGKIYKHFKGGYVYVLCLAKHSDREETEVVYKGLNNGKIYARPIESFCDFVKAPDGKTTTRFSPATQFETDKLYSEIEQEMFALVAKNIDNLPLV